MSSTRIKVASFGPLLPGDVVKLRGEQGTFTFIAAVHEDPDEPPLWLDLHGGKAQHEMWRAIRPERVKVPAERQLVRQRKLRAEREAA